MDINGYWGINDVPGEYDSDIYGGHAPVGATLPDFENSRIVGKSNLPSSTELFAISYYGIYSSLGEHDYEPLSASKNRVYCLNGSSVYDIDGVYLGETGCTNYELCETADDVTDSIILIDQDNGSSWNLVKVTFTP